MCATCLLITFLEAFINVLAQAEVLAIFVRVIMSWVPIRLPFGLNELVWNVTEPVLSPIRRYLPIAGGMDFSPFIALLLIHILASVREGVLLVRVTAPPIEGKANDAVVTLLSTVLGVPRGQVRVERGAAARTKRVSVPHRAAA